VKGPSEQSSVGLLAHVYEIRIVHQQGSLDHAAESSHGNVVFFCAHIVQHFGERINFADCILLHVREVRAANMDIII